MSPFCNLTSPSFTMWQPSIKETYENQTADYVKKITNPLRLKYPYAMDKKEIITSLTKVGQVKLDQQDLFHQGEERYSAYEKDIAIVNIFFGEPTVYGNMHWFSSFSFDIILRIREVAKDDLAGLHLWLWRLLRTLPWNQFYLFC